jgi:maltooligosyltrehalose synthase
LFAGILGEALTAPIGAAAWGPSRLRLPDGLPGDWQDAITGQRHRAADGGLMLAAVLAGFPVALLAARGG